MEFIKQQGCRSRLGFIVGLIISVFIIIFLLLGAKCQCIGNKSYVTDDGIVFRVMNFGDRGEGVQIQNVERLVMDSVYIAKDGTAIEMKSDGRFIIEADTIYFDSKDEFNSEY
ncbi:hypothetical protein K9N50_05390 [bacterium]|nr:hypothetical protein [bacterium]